MPTIKKILLLSVALFIYAAAHAQIEVAKLSSKGFSPFGFGGFLNFSIPVTDNSAAVVEAGVYIFSKDDYHMAVAPVLGGYRQFFGQDDFGFYAEPVAGYTFGGTDIQKLDANGNALYKADGSQVDQSVKGPIGGIGFGYLFEPSGSVQFNISLRAEHVFVGAGNPSLSIIALRISHGFTFGHRHG